MISEEKYKKLVALCEDLISYMEDPMENHHLQLLAKDFRKKFNEIQGEWWPLNAKREKLFANAVRATASLKIIGEVNMSNASNAPELEGLSNRS